MPLCQHCGKEIKEKSHHSGKERVYCSMECFRADRARAPRRIVFCQYCGRQFTETRDRPNLFCSVSCTGKFYGEQRTLEKIERQAVQQERKKKLLDEYKQLLEEQKRLVERITELRKRIDNEKYCKVCGKPFIANNMKQKCCSEECSRKNTNKNKDNRIYRNGKPDNSITLTKLYMRDAGECKLCGKQIDFDCDSNSDDYPSIDHIKPLSKGGTHTWDNVQLACRRCNYLKGNNG